MTARAFWLDWDYDQSRASDGQSRYGHYLRDRARWFDEIAGDYPDDPTVPFAAAVWRIATGPIMVPPLVCSHRRIMSAEVQRSEWNGEAVAIVELVSPRAAAFDTARPPGGGWYRDRPTTYSGEYEGIGDRDLEAGPYLITEARLLLQIPPGTLPKLDRVPAGAARPRQAVDCLNRLVAHLSLQVAPLLERLDPAEESLAGPARY